MTTAFEKTLDVLEWNRFLEILTQNALSPMGQSFIADFRPDFWEREKASIIAEAIIDVVALQSKEKQLPLGDLSDLNMVYKRMSRGGAISVEEFAQVIRNQKGVISLRSVVQTSQLAALQKVLNLLDPLKDWCDVHFPLIDQHGQISDSASEDLRALRMMARDLKNRIDDRLKDYLQDPHLAEIMRDHYVTLRDGRYVLPVKTSYKGRMPGIIHDVSKTESTIFVEPQAIVDLNNQLKVTEREIEIEIERILAQVVDRSKDVVPFFITNQEQLALGDYLQAVSKIVSKWDNFCVATQSDDLSFDYLAHPLLSLQTKVVSNSLEWKEALILSGPNTGGKTVLLKSVGMALLFARAGIPVCAKSAKVPFELKKVFAEMGDDQNLFEKLSTFSAHIHSLSRIFKEASRGDLVLIDEIATGTAPEEGQALARAVIEYFLEKGVRVFVTTHYGALKVMALADERCRVASMAYDTQKRTPLFKIVMDVPGESSALDAADRLGIPQGVLTRARQLLGDDSKDLTKALKNLEKSRKHFEDKLLEVEQNKKLVQQKDKELQRLKELAEEKLRTLSREEAKEILRDFKTLREELAGKILSLKSEGKESTQIFEDISQKTQELKKLSLEDVPFVQPKRGIDPQTLKKGMIVEIAGLGMGQVEEDFQAQTNTKATVSVKVGEIKTRVGVERVFDVTNEEKLRFDQSRKSWLGVEKRKSTTKTQVLAQSKAQVGSFICDVRGRTWDEASRKIDSALNQLTAREVSSVTIIHGHGKEVLKERIRSYLEKERTEFKFRTGSWPGEGGDGVTIVEEAS